ncbi:MAG: polysaccharide biosynthesis tyrosine autokinase [Actinobacteria bacterium]|nr:polysaccharide biosynthesis tyrosine autokinase [Actinomycetota bacterium]
METDTLSQESTPTLRDYVSIVRRRKWAVVSVMLVALGAALILVWLSTPEYISHAEVLLSPSNSIVEGGPGTSQNELNLETETQIVQSPAIAEPAAERMQTSLPLTALLKQVSVKSSGEAEILIISFRSTSQEMARSGAQAFVDSYLEFKRQQAVDVQEEARGQLAAEIEAQTADLARVNRIIAGGTPGSAEYVGAQAERSFLTEQIRDLRSRLTDLSDVVISPGRVIGPASPASEDSRSGFLLLAIGLLVGLVGGIVLAFVLEGLSDRLRGREDLERRLGAPVLGMIPRMRRRRANGLSFAHPRAINGPATEAFRLLRANLVFASGEADIRTVLVTSGSAEEGKTTTVANLGIALAESGRRVVLVSADLRRPDLHEFFGLPNEKGLAEMLLDGRPLSTTRAVGIENLRVIPAGRAVASSSAEILESDAMASVLRRLRETFEFVLIDSPPVFIADPLVIAPQVDAVLVVADARRSSRTSIAFARQQLEGRSPVLLGAVLNRYDLLKPAVQSTSYTHYDTSEPDAAQRRWSFRTVSSKDRNGSEERARATPRVGGRAGS